MGKKSLGFIDSLNGSNKSIFDDLHGEVTRVITDSSGGTYGVYIGCSIDPYSGLQIIELSPYLIMGPENKFRIIKEKPYRIGLNSNVHIGKVPGTLEDWLEKADKDFENSNKSKQSPNP